MHSRSDLAELIRNGENTFVEFKEDRVSSEALAKEFVAFANARGGVVLLGVGDAGGVVGLSRANLEEWVMQCGRDKVWPSIVPAFERIRDYEPGKDIAIVTIGRGLDAHARRHNEHETYYVRVGSTSREASQEELRGSSRGAVICARS